MLLRYDTIGAYDTRCYFNVRSKANMSQLNLSLRQTMITFRKPWKRGGFCNIQTNSSQTYNHVRQLRWDNLKQCNVKHGLYNASSPTPLVVATCIAQYFPSVLLYSYVKLNNASKANILSVPFSGRASSCSDDRNSRNRGLVPSDFGTRRRCCYRHSGLVLHWSL